MVSLAYQAGAAPADTRSRGAASHNGRRHEEGDLVDEPRGKGRGDELPTPFDHDAQRAPPGEIPQGLAQVDTALGVGAEPHDLGPRMLQRLRPCRARAAQRIDDDTRSSS